RAVYLTRDLANGSVKVRRGARLAALTSGGAIPELGDFRVVAEPDDVLVGTVNEDWAIESSAGDVFLLGTTSWRISRVEPGTVRVVDAHGAPPSVPFWLGEAAARTEELSGEVSDLRAEVGERLRARTSRARGAGWRPSAGSTGRRPTRSPATSAPAWPRSACCRRSGRWCWSGSSTRPAGC